MNIFRFALCLLLLCCGIAYAIDTQPAFADRARQSRYEHITSQLRCLVCQNETIADSNANLAADLRLQVRDLLKAGKSDEEVYKYMTDRYGDFVLYNPPLKTTTWLLWAAPVLFVFIGIVSAVLFIVRKTKAENIDVDGESADSEAGAA